MKEFIYADVSVDEKTFRRFAYFDAFRLKKRYRAPLAFALMLAAFSAACVFALRGRPQAALLGGVLLAVGVLLPAAWFLSFALSVREKARQFRRPKKAYALTLTEEPDGLSVVSADGKERVKLEWRKTYGAYRVPGCVYLYAHPTRAFLIPDGQASVPPEKLFAFLTRALGEKRTQDLSAKKPKGRG